MRLIDSDALIISLAKDRAALVNNHVQHGEICRVDETIWKVVDAPTIDAAPVVRGEWEVAIGYDPNKKVQCQNCYKMACEPTPYCPYCGAKMEGEKEAEE